MTDEMRSGWGGEFRGKKVLITGGSKGLGLATARLLARDGADIFLAYRSDEASAASAVSEIRALGARCEMIRADLAEESGCLRMFDAVEKLTERLDFYVHNAAATAFRDLMELDSSHVDKTMNISVKSFILGMQRAAAMMPDGGAVVAVSGMDTLKAVPRHGLLGAAKAALETLVAYFAHEVASRGIRVNAVNPGFIDTDSTRKYLGPMFETVKAQFAGSVPLRREPKLSEVADVIAFLCSMRSSWVVGQTIYVDGGFDFAMPRMQPSQ